MSEQKPIEVAIIGGGCAGITAAFELTRPEHKGKYHVTVYQLGWRLGGKGASGRGPADRIEEHGLHIWLGFYENAFRLLRECYAELKRDPRKCRFADWRDAFFPEPFIGVADRSYSGVWQSWLASFEPTDGAPGDPLTQHNPFSVTSYLVRTAKLLQELLLAVRTPQASDHTQKKTDKSTFSFSQFFNDSLTNLSTEEIVSNVARVLQYGMLATTAGLIEAVGLLQALFSALPRYPSTIVERLLEAIAANARRQLEVLIEKDDEIRRLWEVIDLTLAILLGIFRFNLVNDPRGFDAINDYECREWLRLNGASERSLNSALLRGLYDLALAYEDGDFQQPGLAAGQAIRGAFRMFFTYRGALFWKMKAGMGDIVFAPFYEVLKKRGVSFAFFHRLENVKIVDVTKLAPGERPYVECLEFDVQAEIKGGGEYQPLVDIRGLSCWPSQPDYAQLVDGERLKREQRNFESFWDQRKAKTKTLRVIDNFDFVVLSIGIGAIPYVCREILARDTRWQAMITHVKTVATQAFQVWLCEDMKTLGWPHLPSSISGFVQPFDTWADMGHLASEEHWPTRPRAIAYFCSALPDPRNPAELDTPEYPLQRQREVRDNAIHFLNHEVKHLWPKAQSDIGHFRWDLLMDPTEQNASGITSPPANVSGESRFDSQFWTANVNPSDRYVLALPGSMKYRISPLDDTYDNLTIAGDWTDCGFNEGCVEAAIMSGRLAAHAISHSPPLEDIVGYDHP